ncbi:MAG TPA: THUMP domain-containing protein, partial [Nitrospira sp.]|nr:THUMP domain-containing protein [Nitrospira sp.]
MRCAIVHYHELALKGRNRDFFEHRLIGNIRTSLRDLGATRIESLRGRLRVALLPSISDHAVKERLSTVFGIANFSVAQGVPLNLAKPDLDQLTRGIGDAVVQRTFDTFRVTAKRADKRLTLTSMDVERIVGQYVR